MTQMCTFHDMPEAECVGSFIQIAKTLNPALMHVWVGTNAYRIGA